MFIQSQSGVLALEPGHNKATTINLFHKKVKDYNCSQSRLRMYSEMTTVVPLGPKECGNHGNEDSRDSTDK